MKETPSDLTASEQAINAWLDRVVSALERYALNRFLGRAPEQSGSREPARHSWIMRRIINPLRVDFGALARIAR